MTLAVSFLMSQAAWAGKGGSTACLDLFEVGGTVVYVHNNDAVVVDTGQSKGLVTVYGIGPERYWDQKDVPYLTKGVHVIITAYESDLKKYVAYRIVIENDNGSYSIDLRNEDCEPLWRGIGKKKK